MYVSSDTNVFLFFIKHPTVNKKETKDGDENIGEDRGTHDKDEIER